MVCAFYKDYGVMIDLQPSMNTYGLYIGRPYQWSIFKLKNGIAYDSVYVSQAESPEQAFELGMKKLQQIKEKKRNGR